MAQEQLWRIKRNLIAGTALFCIKKPQHIVRGDIVQLAMKNKVELLPDDIHYLDDENEKLDEPEENGACYSPTIS